MANLFSDAERTAYKSMIQDVHDTFARSIIVWRDSAEEITSTDSDYDAFSDQGPRNVTYVPESKEFKARIKYIDKQDKEFGLTLAAQTIRDNTSGIDITQEFQLVRIKVNKEANDYIKDSARINIDGDDLNYTPITIPRPHGVFELDWYTIYLKSSP